MSRDALNLRSTSLVDVQSDLSRLITAPTGVTDALRADSRTANELATIVVGNEVTAVERLDIYANMYFYRIHDVLRDTFSKVLAAVGDSMFQNFCTDYLLQFPSRHHSLGRVGEHFAEFLRTQTEHPWLADLAALEWARLDVFDERDQPVVTADEVRQLAPAEFLQHSVLLVDAARLLTARYRVHETWSTLETATDEVSAPELRNTQVLVWRKDVAVFHREITHLEHELLLLASRGTTLGALCQEVTRHLPKKKPRSQRSKYWDVGSVTNY